VDVNVPDSGGPATTGAPIDAPASEGGPFHLGGEGPITPPAPERLPVEEWQRRRLGAKGRPELDWPHACAAVLFKWVVGEELTAAEYAAAREAAGNVELGYAPPRRASDDDADDDDNLQPGT
jgi:hypothetical protein